MSIIRVASACIVGAGIGLSAITSSGAADMPVKAVPVPAVTNWVLDVHGFLDVTVASTRVTGGGFLLYPTSSTLLQITNGISLDLYKDPTGFINKVSIYGGIWNELYEASPPPGVRHWQEFDWWAGISVGFAKHWTISAESLNFVFPGGGTAYNYNFALSFNDSFLNWPVVFNPYVSLFYNDSGGSTVVLGKTSGGYRVTLGMNPTIDFSKPYGIPLTIWFPTSVVLAPTEFWNRNDGTTNFCGATSTLPCALDNVGFVTTGIQAKYTLESFIPKRLGTWYVKAGVQYYHIVNDALLAAQAFNFATNSFPGAKQDVVLVNGGFGFSY